MTSNGKLPPGWRRVKLGEVCARIETVDPRRAPDAQFIYVDISSIDRSTKRIVSASALMGRDAPSRARRIIHKGDVLVATTRPNLNAVALVGDDLDGQVCSTGLCVLRPDGRSLESTYLYHYTKHETFVRALSNLVSGAMYPAVTDKQVLDQYIPLPPLDEQKRIVARLNEQMAVAEKARKAAEELLDDARALPNAFLREALPLEGQRLPRNWRWVALGELMSRSTGTIDPRRHPREVFALYSIPAYEQGAPQMVSGSSIGSSKQHVQRRDVLLSKIVPHIRRSWIVDSHAERTIASTEWIVLRTINALPEYLRFILIGDDFHRRFMDTVSGVGGSLLRARPSLAAEIQVPLPPLDEQKRVVARLSEQTALAARMRRAADEALEDLRAIPSALLRRALAGVS